MARVKTKVFQIRASEEFMEILKSLSEKKGMSQANLKEQYEQDKKEE